MEVDVLIDHSKHENITSFYGVYGVKVRLRSRLVAVRRVIPGSVELGSVALEAGTLLWVYHAWVAIDLLDRGAWSRAVLPSGLRLDRATKVVPSTLSTKRVNG